MNLHDLWHPDCDTPYVIHFYSTIELGKHLLQLFEIFFSCFLQFFCGFRIFLLAKSLPRFDNIEQDHYYDRHKDLN